MAKLLAARNVPVIVKHTATRRRRHRHYEGYAAFFAHSLAIARSRYFARQYRTRPGIGFGKTPEQSLTALRGSTSSGYSPATPRRRIAQALHQLGHAVGARSTVSAFDRSPPCRQSRVARGSSGP